MKPCAGQLLFCIFSGCGSRARQISFVGALIRPPTILICWPLGPIVTSAPRSHALSLLLPGTWVGLFRFGFSRLFEFPTLACVPRRESRSASSQEFLQQRRATHSIFRTLGSTVLPSCTWRQTEMEANPTQDQPVQAASTAGGNQLWLSRQSVLVPTFSTQQHHPTAHQ